MYCTSTVLLVTMYTLTATIYLLDWVWALGVGQTLPRIQLQLNQVEVLVDGCLVVWKHEPAGSWWSVSVVPMSDQAELPLTRCNITLGSRGQTGNNHGTTRHHTRQILQIVSPIKTYVYPVRQKM